ncbi:transcriptional regulator [Bosea caraganae]|uniref:Transcriptional regulator n=1 Tax=Bosea caraganae TaxID=2763117 RepID=A0A370KZJ6_9HYPH|nr:winged helix-turn-helix domain-containing protein [Bosea caraganae]RDJ20286.1 transcriptional regulator [Bosea caraganae]RDJ23983.1 transcriptional regulator [Bosea caraganae]
MDQSFRFGPFRLIPGQQLLSDENLPVRLGGRALEILTALVEKRGDLVSKAELLARAWPGVLVEESNLKVHVSALRKALGDGQPGRRFITTVSGRGYRFIGTIESAEDAIIIPQSPSETRHNLPTSTRTIGRDDAIESVRSRLLEKRFVTLVGAGGIGKTKVATATAEKLIGEFEDGIWFVDLATLRDSSHIPSEIANTIGIKIYSEDIISGILSYIKRKTLLIILDNCEHIIENAALVAEAIIQGAPSAYILATSREPLQYAREYVQRIRPLSTPPVDASITAAELKQFSAVQLFIERAAASLDDFDPSDDDVFVIAHICRHLEGVALAIELAAVRVDAFGLHGVASMISENFQILNRGRRTAPSRQKSLAATLEWSYNLLSNSEQKTLRTLSVFTGDFTFTAASEVISDETGSRVIDDLASLVTKSLISADVGGAVVNYRLLETTRAYAVEKLRQGEEDRAAMSHYTDLLIRTSKISAAELKATSIARWENAYSAQISDIRNALKWAFSDKGDLETALALTLAALPLWLTLGLMEECRSGVERALGCDRLASGMSDAKEMKLRAAHCRALIIRGPSNEVGDAWLKVVEIAERVDDHEHRLWGLWGLSTLYRARGSHRTALIFAERCRAYALSMGDAAAAHAAARLIAITQFHLGDFSKCRETMDDYSARAPQTASSAAVKSNFPYNQRVGALGTLTLLHWVEGDPDRALQLANQTVEEARAIYDGPSLADVLLHSSIPVALSAGAWSLAEKWIDLTEANLRSHALNVAHLHSLCLEAVLRILQGDAAGTPRLAVALAELGQTGSLIRYPYHLGTLAVGYGLAGQLGKALETIDKALTLTEQHDENWCLAELLRIKGELLAQDALIEQAEAYFIRAREVASVQGALSWNLRATVSLAKLWRKSDRHEEAKAMLSSTIRRFDEGFQTRDLQVARNLSFELSEN